MTAYSQLWDAASVTTTKVMAGGLFSCVRLDGGRLLGGMLDGLIKMWSVADRDWDYAARIDHAKQKYLDQTKICVCNGS